MCNYQIAIDWAWGDTNACGKPVCLSYVVREADPVLIRGPLSARQCVQACIISFIPLGLETAVRWLMAAQAHNPGAQQCLWDNRGAAVAYAIAHYATQVTMTKIETEITPKQILDAARSIKTSNNPEWSDVMETKKSM